ncbi:MAG: hypothetical protein PHU21_13970 [Elusimicrobia bacterium]|nr:hypothetical protein [Elusimicrobiota bacterium]
MERCRYCGSMGLFFGLNKDGLCATCQHMISLEVDLRRKAIADASHRVDSTLNPQSKIAGLDLLVENIEALRKFEARGIPSVEGSPSALLEEARSKRQEVVLAAAHAELQDMMAKVEKAAAWEAKRHLYATFLLRMEDYKRKLDDPSRLSDVELHVRRADHQAQLDAIMGRALAAEKEGKRPEAVRAYQEAAEFLGKSCLAEPARTRLRARLNAKTKLLR